MIFVLEYSSTNNLDDSRPGDKVMAIVTPPVRRSGEFSKLLPHAYKAIVTLGNAGIDAGIEKEMLELVKLRASQINGCAYCVQYHLTEARALGVDQTKLDLLPVWREAGLFSEREIAALAWTEALTLVVGHGIPDEVDELARRVFSPLELAGLTAAIGAINVWNRIGVGYRLFPEIDAGVGG
jgi:AhpD family alkylhydroperoxidase